MSVVCGGEKTECEERGCEEGEGGEVREGGGVRRGRGEGVRK